MSYLRYLCLFAYSGTHNILSNMVSVLKEARTACPLQAPGFTPCSLSFLVFSVVLFVFVLCLVYPMLPVSLDCPFLVVPSGFAIVYLGLILKFKLVNI